MSDYAPNPFPPVPIPLYDGTQKCGTEDGHLAELFFPQPNGTQPVRMTEQAKALCRKCAFVRPCRDYALGDQDTAGIWGGLTNDERKKRRRRRRGESEDRPPPVVRKHNANGYGHGCRCAVCTEAHRIYERERRSKP